MVSRLIGKKGESLLHELIGAERVLDDTSLIIVAGNNIGGDSLLYLLLVMVKLYREVVSEFFLQGIKLRLCTIVVAFKLRHFF